MERRALRTVAIGFVLYIGGCAEAENDIRDGQSGAPSLDGSSPDSTATGGTMTAGSGTGGIGGVSASGGSTSIGEPGVGGSASGGIGGSAPGGAGGTGGANPDDWDGICNGLRTTRGEGRPDIEFPGYLESYVDPVYGTKITRITGDKGTPIPNAGGTWYNRTRHSYDTDQAWNADESLMYLRFGNVLLDGETYEVVPESRARAPRRGSWHPTDPALAVHVSGTTVRTFNVFTGVTTDVVSFPEYSELFMSLPYYQMSRDGRFLGVSGRRSTDGEMVGFIVDLIDRKRASVDFAFEDYGFYSEWDDRYALLPSPSGKYAFMMSRGPNDNAGSRGEETVVFTFEGDIVSRLWEGYIHCPGHGDFGVGPDGHDVKVGRCDDSNPLGGEVVYFDFEDGQVHGTGLSSATHHSGRGWNRPGGWTFASQIEGGLLSAVKLEGGRMEYIADARTISPVNYWAQPQAAASPSGTRIVFATNWGTGDLSDDDAHAFVADFREQCRQ